MAGRIELLREWTKEAVNLGIEIVIVHDIQDNLTQADLDALITELQSPLLQLVTGEFRSPGLARNAGKKIARGEWIAFWDSDDRPNPAAILEMVVQSSDTDSDIAIGNFEWFDETRQTIRVDVRRKMTLNNVAMNVGIWRFTIRKSIVNKIDFRPYRLGEDQVFASEAIGLAREINFYNKAVYRYYFGGSGHLSNNILNRDDLVLANLAVEKLLLLQRDGDAQSFLTKLWLRQRITMLRHSEKNWAIIKILKNAITIGPRTIPFSVRLFAAVDVLYLLIKEQITKI